MEEFKLKEVDMSNKIWTKTNDYYNREVVKEDVYSRKCRYGKIFLIDAPGSFTYTFSCGANSEYSFTGCFWRYPKISNVNQAMDVLDKLAVLWFSDETFALNDFLAKYK